MISNWLGRILGLSGTNKASSGSPPDLALPDIAAPAASLVDADELAHELARARRYEQDLSIVVLSARPMDGPATTGDLAAPGLKLPQMVALLTAVALRDVLRRSDVVCYHAAERRFILALTESALDDAHTPLERIRTYLRTRLHLQTRAGMAAFPRDAFTLDELVSTAHARAVDAQPSATTGTGRRPRGSSSRRRGDAPDSGVAGRRARGAR
jgi:hypothetical protein